MTNQLEKHEIRLEIKTGLKAGYRPVHGLVYPDSMGRWMKGWYDMDSRDASSGAALGASVPPPPPPL